MRTIKWEESWSVRRLAYGRRYIPHLLHVLAIWALWLLAIGMLVVDPSLRSRERASRIGVLVLGGTLYRLWVETLSRKIRWSDEGFFVALIGKFECPLSRISDLQFSEIDDEWSRAEFYATKKSGRRKKYVIGIPRTAVAKLKALFGLEPDFDFSSDEAEENKPRSMRSMAYSAFFYDLCWKMLGWIMICGAVFFGVNDIVFAKDMKEALEGEASAVFGGLVGVAVIHQKAVHGWCLRMLTGERDQGDDPK